MSNFYYTFYDTPQWQKQYNTVPNETTSGAGVRQSITPTKIAFWGNPTYFGTLDNPRGLTCAGLNNCKDIRSDNANWLNEGFNNTPIVNRNLDNPIYFYTAHQTGKHTYSEFGPNKSPSRPYPKLRSDLNGKKEFDHIQTYNEQFTEPIKVVYPQTAQDLSLVKEEFNERHIGGGKVLTRWMFIGHVEPIYNTGKYKFPLEARKFQTVSGKVIYQYRVNTIYNVAYEPKILKENQIINVFMNDSYPQKFRVKLLTDQ